MKTLLTLLLFAQPVVAGSLWGGNLAPLPQVYYTSPAASNTISNTTAETLFSTAPTIPASTLTAGNKFHIEARGFLSAAVGGTTFNLAVQYGATDLASTGALVATSLISNKAWRLSADVAFPTVGAGGTALADLNANVYASLGVAQLGLGSSVGTVAVDTTTAKTFGVTVVWGAGAAGNTATCQQLTITRIQ